MPPKVVAIGETLWDLLPGGRQLGGAPANFAFHAGQLGADVAFISRVGADSAGRDALSLLAERGLSVELVQIDPAAPTGTVTVEFDAAPAAGATAQGATHRFIIHTDVAWDQLAAPPEALAARAGPTRSASARSVSARRWRCDPFNRLSPRRRAHRCACSTSTCDKNSILAK